MSLVKSKQRVTDHGEVFTPAWLVEAMLDLVKGETERIDSLFSQLGKHEIFTPTRTYPPMTVSELVAATPEASL
ncbi:MAG: hypothetical protein IAE94_02690 [Chthoniobacterales bacterium]|nr:hypothetical protein [Chthoniobacterales bacterium]